MIKLILMYQICKMDIKQIRNYITGKRFFFYPTTKPKYLYKQQRDNDDNELRVYKYSLIAVTFQLAINF